MGIRDVLQNQQPGAGGLAIQPLEQTTLITGFARSRPGHDALMLRTRVLFQHLPPGTLYRNAEIPGRLYHGRQAGLLTLGTAVLHKQLKHRLRAMPQQGVHRMEAGIHQGFLGFAHWDACTLHAPRHTR